MSQTSSTDPHFLNTMSEWIAERKEILTLFRYSAMAGSRDFQLWRDYEALASKIAQLPPLCSIIAFREPQLPIRGIVDAQFIERCKRTIPDGEDFLILDQLETIHNYPYCSWTAFHHTEGMSHAELKEELEHEDWNGRLVAAGPCPSYLFDSEEVISAVVLDANGSMSDGIY